MKIRFIPILIIICSIWVIGYNYVNKYQLPYEYSENSVDEDLVDYSYKEADELLININTATVEEFETLPEIGVKTAEKIVTLRDSLGGFDDLKDLLLTDGVSDEKFELILPYITIE